MDYPTGVPDFAAKVDGIDIVLAEHVNRIQENVTAIATDIIGERPRVLPPGPAITLGALTPSVGFDATENRTFDKIENDSGFAIASAKFVYQIPLPLRFPGAFDHDGSIRFRIATESTETVVVKIIDSAGTSHTIATVPNASLTPAAWQTATLNLNAVAGTYTANTRAHIEIQVTNMEDANALDVGEIDL